MLMSPCRFCCAQAHLFFLTSQHRGYDDVELDNDIAILILKEDLVFSSSVQPVGRLAAKKFDKIAENSDNCAVSGWGRFNDGKYNRDTPCQNLSSEVCDQVRLKLVCSASEATQRFGFVCTAVLDTCISSEQLRR